MGEFSTGMKKGWNDKDEVIGAEYFKGLIKSKIIVEKKTYI